METRTRDCGDYDCDCVETMTVTVETMTRDCVETMTRDCGDYDCDCGD